MAAPQMERPDEEGQRERAHPVRTVRATSPPPEDPGPERGPEDAGGRPRPTTLITVLALVMALVLGTATAFLGMDEAEENAAARNLEVDFSTGEAIFLIIVGSVVAALGLLPARWGWWVMVFVVLANYVLHFYNLTVGSGGWFQDLGPDAVGAAVLAPLIGVVVGAVIQLIYRFAAGDP